jgi:hypothetical protein
MDTEFADVIDHDVTTITCVCGNTVSNEGLIQANSQGIPVHIGASTPVPAGLATWPEDQDLYTLCSSCGRVYHDVVIEETGTAPVAPGRLPIPPHPGVQWPRPSDPGTGRACRRRPGRQFRQGPERGLSRTTDDRCVVCPWHASVFSLRSGEVMGGPATAGQPRLNTRIENGLVEVSLPGAG